MDSQFADITIKTHEAPLGYFGFTEYEFASEARDADQIFLKRKPYVME